MLSATAVKMASKLLAKSPKSSKKSYASGEQDDEVIIKLKSKKKPGLFHDFPS